MTLGEKLRQARLEAGLSQRQLCGQEITRNMLSQIEHGLAQPSVSTLQFLARQLGLPVGYFFDEDFAASGNSGCMEAAWSAFTAGNGAAALSALEAYQAGDALFDREHAILKALVLLQLAETVRQQGRELFAKKLLNQAQALEKDMPWLPGLREQRVRILGRMEAPQGESSLPALEEWLCLHAAAALNSGEGERAARLLDACRSTDAEWHCLRGRASLQQKDYLSATVHLQQAEAAYPQTVIPLLEEAFRELGDYKSAYEYACKGRG